MNCVEDVDEETLNQYIVRCIGYKRWDYLFDADVKCLAKKAMAAGSTPIVKGQVYPVLLLEKEPTK